MKKWFLPMAACLLLVSVSWAEEEKLLPLPEGLDNLAPPAGFDQLPPMPGEKLEGVSSNQDLPDPSNLAPMPSEPSEALKALDKAQPTPTTAPRNPAPPIATPTVLIKPASNGISVPMAVEKDDSVPAVEPSKPASVPALKKEAVTASETAPKEGKGMSIPMAVENDGAAAVKPIPASPQVQTKEIKAVQANAPIAVVPGGGTLTDYFPVEKGKKWTYVYLKTGEGKASRNREVQCLESKTFPNGTVRVTFKVAENPAAPILESYSLIGSLVQQTSSAGKALVAHYLFRIPKAGSSTAWTITGSDGIVKTCSASYGKGLVYKKVYQDCVIVKEKTASSTVLSYYAKGLGLVAVEVYGTGMKLLEEKSYALIDESSK